LTVVHQCESLARRWATVRRRRGRWWRPSRHRSRRGPSRSRAQPLVGGRRRRRSHRRSYEEGEETSLTGVRIDAVTLGEAYRSGYTQGEPKLINTDGAYTNLYRRDDLLEFSFPFPSDPSAMTRDEIVRRIVETEREARRWSELPQGVRDALAEERAALLQARDELAPPAGVEFAP
jgi:hypothetical protein